MNYKGLSGKMISRCELQVIQFSYLTVTGLHEEKETNIQFIKLRLVQPQHEKSCSYAGQVDDSIKLKPKDLKHGKFVKHEEVIKHKSTQPAWLSECQPMNQEVSG